MKYAIVILDGAAGYPLDCFDAKTTLEYARTPHMDELAATGMVGLSKNVPDGCEPSSNVACMSIMGYDPARFDIGRGAIEGAACGVELQGDEVALRLNLCNVEGGVMKSYSTDNITTQSAQTIADELKERLDDEVFTLHKSVGFRCILTVKGHPELMDLSYSPAHNITDSSIAGHEPQGEGAALLIDYMERADALLATSAENARREAAGLMRATNAWPFWPGMKPAGMPSFVDSYKKRAGMLSAVDLLNGLAALTQVERFEAPGITDGPDNDYASQGARAIEMLDALDVAFIHVEAPDTAGHDGDPRAKVDAVESIDREIIGRLIEYAKGDDLRILALPDHPTPVALKTHSPEPVPFIMAGPGIEATPGMRLTEDEGKAGGVLVDAGHKLMGMLLA